MPMNNSQELFQINKRINQIKRDLQIRSQKAHQWSVPYQKILKKPQLVIVNTQTPSNNQQLSQQQPIYKTKQQKKYFLQQKVKNSRQKINNFHNQLKQLQQLQQRKTKLYVKKQNHQEFYLQKQTFDRRASLISNQQKALNKTFNPSMMSSSGIFSKTMSHTNLRTLKQRVNPFTSIKPQLIVQIFQEAKQSGKQNVVNQALGVGIEFTPYSHITKKDKKQEDLVHKILNESINISNNNRKSVEKLSENDHNKKNHLLKILGSKVQQKRQIYMKQPVSDSSMKKRKSGVRSKKNLNMFEQRMKKLLEEANTIENYKGTYIQMLKQQKREKGKNNLGKISANKTYLTIIGQN